MRFVEAVAEADDEDDVTETPPRGCSGAIDDDPNDAAVAGAAGAAVNVDAIGAAICGAIGGCSMMRCASASSIAARALRTASRRRMRLRFSCTARETGATQCMYSVSEDIQCVLVSVSF